MTDSLGKLASAVWAVVLAVSAVASTIGILPQDVQAAGWPYQDPALPVEQRVSDLLSRMTLDEKIGQMLQVERKSATPAQVRDNGIGSVLSGGGSNPTPNTPAAWADTVDAFQAAAMQTRLQIPMIYGVDAVHGHNNVYGATIFPHNIGLGATRDPELVRRIGAATAKEVRTTGIQWNFAPCLCAPQDIRWGRTYEGFSENVTDVGELGAAYLQGLQGTPGGSGFLKGTKAVGSIKHWLGDGNTADGDDQGNVPLTEQELDPYIQPYREAIAEGARTVMISLTTWNQVKSHAHQHLITDILKNGLGFGGMVVSDWNGTYSLVDQGYYPNYSEALKATVNAGIDMFMEPDQWQQFIPALRNLVNSSQVSVARIDDAVGRILRVKIESGLFESPYTDRSLLAGGTFGGAEHRAIAREAVRKSATLLKNENHILPLSKNSRLFVAGSKANDIGIQSGGWTITWQGGSGGTTPGTTILQGIQLAAGSSNVTYSPSGAGAAGHDAAIVVIGEQPYAEMMGDVGAGQPRPDLELSAEDVSLLNTVKSSGVPMVVVMLSGRPMIVANQLPDWKAFVAAWLPGTEGAGLADVLFGDYDFTGRLPVTWPRTMPQLPANSNDAGGSPLYPYGYGLTASVNGVKDVPAPIEAENYNAASGVQTEATTDANGGLNTGYIDPGDWLEYRIHVPSAGTYKLRLRAASPAGAPNAAQVSAGGTAASLFSIPSTGGWQSWTTVSRDITLNAGVQTMRIIATAGGWNLNWLDLIPVSSLSAPGNVLANPGLETGDLSGWSQWNSGANAQYADSDHPYTGSYKLTHWAPSAYRQLTYQTLSVPNGTYRFSARVRSSGGQKSLHLYAKTGGREKTSEIASNIADYWSTYTINNIQVTNGQIEVGVWSDANAGNWSAFDQMELVQQ